ncbi:hypothetical protein [Streptomyces sp. NPDC088736]|uniref:hypothetical protein n=1 Tax=Streptomyces sp. NPDC088736 TaxID=3365881 RepID=UPI0037F27402
MTTGVQSGEIWKLRKPLRIETSRSYDPTYRHVQQVGEFVYVREAHPFSALVHNVKIDADRGIWVPADDGVAFDCRTALIESNGVRYDVAERYLHDGDVLVSLDPHRHFDLPPRG